MHNYIIIPILFFIMSQSAQSQETEGLPAAFVCELEAGIFNEYVNGDFRSETEKPFSLVFASIDWDSGKAQMIGNLGAVEIDFLIGQHQINLIEITESGSINITSIFYIDWEEGDVSSPWPAFHSRHIGYAGGPMVSQYPGRCYARD